MDDELDRAAREVAELAARAQAELDAMVAARAATFEAVLALQQWFNAQFLDIMARHLSVVPGGDVWSVRQVGDMLVGDVTLSRKLYTNARQTAHEVTALVRQHAQGVQQARELALRLYEGYSPQDGIRRPLEGAARARLPKALRMLTSRIEDRASLQAVYEQGMRYAASLKTEPLKAAYLEAFARWAKDGGGSAALKKRLQVAHEEKSRYMANRIAQTELARAHQRALAAELMADDSIGVVQVMMSASHPEADICDLHAKANLWGLGKGCYPKAKAPGPPYHPHCRCHLRSRPDLDASDARAVPGGEAGYLRKLPLAEAEAVMGSRAQLQQALDGEPVLEIVNAGVPAWYRTVRLEDVAATPRPRR